jgi:hypothetical protein
VNFSHLLHSLKSIGKCVEHLPPINGKVNLDRQMYECNNGGEFLQGVIAMLLAPLEKTIINNFSKRTSMVFMIIITLCGKFELSYLC